MALHNFGILFSNKLWTIDTTGEPRWWRRLVRFFKLIRITFSTFTQNRMGFQCVALSYFFLMAIVPLAAFIFAVGGGLGIEDKLAEYMYVLFPSYPEMIGQVLDWANNIVSQAESGIVGLVGALGFLWTILWLMFQVERVFNNVWGILKIPRKIYKRFSFYLGVLVLTPFLVLIFGSGIVYYTNLTNLIGLDLGDVRFLPKILGYLAFYVVVAFTLSAMYKFIPAVKVRYLYALKSALVAAAFFVVFQYVYLEMQVLVSRLNAVYGVIAAIPLFLIWMNFSWQIIIYGAELTYGFQHVDSYHIPEWEDK